MKTNKKILLLLMGVGLSVSCKKEKPGILVKTEDSTAVITPLPEEQRKTLVPVQVGSGKSRMIFTYRPDYSLSKIDYADGASTVLNYTKTGLPSSLMRYDRDGKLLLVSEYEPDNQGRIIRSDHYDLQSGDYKLIDYFTLQYTSSLQPAALKYYDYKGKLLNELQISYSAAGNRIADQLIAGGLQVTYAYDDKNGLFKNAGFAWLLAVEKEHPLFYSLLNNLSTFKSNSDPDENKNFGYTYNADQYPAAISTGTTDSKVTYQVVN